MNLRNVVLLASGQALMVTAMSVVIITSSDVGKALAPNPLLKTLPIALMFVAITLTSIPASMFMERFGRKAGFIFGSMFGITGALVATWAITIENFWLFTSGITLMGIFNGFGNFYRFTAADAVDEKFKSRAIAYVLSGGIFAAFLGATLSANLRDSIPGAIYAGGYASLVIGYVIILVLMSFLSLPSAEAVEGDVEQSLKAQRPLKVIVRQPKYIVALICGMFGYSVMSFIMTATPPAMEHHSPEIHAAVPVIIQWHMLAMFVPSFFTGSLINRFGVYPIMFIGGVLGLVCVLINQTGESYWHYWSALVLLGLSWNFTFTGATTLLTQTYHASERGKAQAFNDFIVFASVSIASLSAGALQHIYGWHTVNIGVVPLLGIILLSIVWIKLRDRKELAVGV